MASIELEDRLARIESRLSEIERELKPLSQPWTKIAAKPQPVSSVSQNTSPSVAPIPQEEAKPGNWLGMIAVICFVLAAGFIVKLSIESGWLTPARQIGIAVLFGFGLIGAGFTLMKTDKEYASLLPGAGIIVLYLTTFAAHRYYSLISFETALALTSLVAGLCVWLYTQIKHDVYAITASAGAYLSPVLLGLHSGAVFSLYYFLLCSISFAVISIWVQSRLLTLVSSYLAILTSGLIGMGLGQDVLVASILALHFAVFSVGTLLYTTQNHNPLTESESWSHLPVLLIFYALEYYFIERINPYLAPWISLGFAAALIGLYVTAKKHFPDGLASQSLIVAFVTLACFHAGYLTLMPADAKPWLFVAIMFGVAFSPLRLTSREYNGASCIPAIAVIAILAIEYLSILSHLFDGSSGTWILLSVAALASIWAVIVTEDNSKPTTHGHILLGCAHMLAILGFYRLTHDAGSLAVSASWLMYAVGVMVFAFIRQDQIMAKSALFVLGFAAGKALLYDASSAPTLVRIFCLLLTGVVLYGSGLLMRKFERWER